MKLLHARNLSAALVIALLAGCVTQPSQRVVYRDNGNGGGHNYGASQVCHECGTIRGIEQIEYRAGNSGGGAVLGAIIGGVLGSTIGKGNGRTAATVGGAVVGGFAGNAVEQNNNGGDGLVWRYRVALDDGRNATITQRDNPGFRRGDQVIVRGDHIEPMR
jgi:outer membrane lipoprotein SlyB